MNSYFKYFDEMNKLNNYIRNENNWINYNDLILDFIYEKRDLKLANIIFPLVENKKLLTRFIEILNLFENKKIEWIKIIFDNGFSETSEIDIFAFDNALLKYSAGDGLIEIVKYLVEKGADVHVNNDEALKFASFKGRLEVVKYLVENGADVHIYDYALRYASIKGHFEIVRYLVENGADIHVNNDEALKWASKYGHLEIVEYLSKIS